MDISQTVAPNSQQVNADDLIAGPRTITITGVEAGTREQPVFIHTKEFEGRTYRPSKSMRRVLIAIWGSNGSDYIGKQLTIFRNPEIKFGGEAVGGIEISHASHIDKPVEARLMVARGKRGRFTVQPLPTPNTPTAPAPLTDADKWEHAIATADSVDQLRNLWERAKKDNALNHVFDTGITLTERITQAKTALEQGGQE